MDEVQIQSENKFRALKDNIISIKNRLNELNQRDINMLEAKNVYIKHLEERIDDRFEQERISRDECCDSLITVINKRFDLLTNELCAESKNRYESIENLKQFMEITDKETPYLKEALLRERNNRIKGDKNIEEMLSENMEEFCESINSNIKQREKSEEEMLDKIKSTLNNTKKQIISERNNRRKAEENILSLIEDTVKKMDEIDNIEEEECNCEDFKCPC